MNPIQFALRETSHRIPPAILDSMFIKTTTRNHNWARLHAPTLSIDHQIRDKVIEGRVLPVINLISGQRELIPLQGLVATTEVDYSQIIHIPKERTNGRSIVCPYAIAMGSQTGSMNGAFNTSYSGQVSGLGEAARAVTQSRQPIPVISDANIALVGENTISLRSPMRFAGPAWLDCLLEHNQQLSNVQPGAYRHFANLVVMATKAYIYNNILIPMDQAELIGGMSLGQFSNVVQSYSDSEELFQELLLVWESVAIMSDPVQHMDHIQTIMGGLY